MATVYLAHDNILNRDVAVKVLHGDLATDSVALERFNREANASTSLSHPNIVDIYDVGEENGNHYIVMEYIKGYTLKQLIQKRGSLPVKEAVWLMKQLAAALKEAHEKGIIHRDVKSQNVLIKADGTVKLSDFGIALANDAIQLTSTDAVLGSVHYLAPECAKGKQASVQSDIYSLGIVFYEALVGTVPFKGDQPVNIAMKHIREELPSVVAQNPEIPQAVENILIKSCAKNPDLRYRSTQELLNDLSACLKPEHAHDAKLVLKDTIEIEDKSRKQNSSNILFGCLVGVLVLAVCLLVFFGLKVSGFFGNSTKMVKVPDITGISIIEAEDILQEYGLEINHSSIKREMTENIEAGKIISCEPLVDSEVEKGTRISIVVSSGVYATVSDYVGKNISDVRTELEAIDNIVIEEKIDSEASSSLEPGTITKQEGLEAGSKYNPNVANKIILYYAPYPTMLIPFGTLGRSVNDVYQEFSSEGYKVETREISYDSLTDKEKQYSANTVCRISPEEGTSYKQEGDKTIVLYYHTTVIQPSPSPTTTPSPTVGPGDGQNG